MDNIIQKITEYFQNNPILFWVIVAIAAFLIIVIIAAIVVGVRKSKAKKAAQTEKTAEPAPTPAEAVPVVSPAESAPQQPAQEEKQQPVRDTAPVAAAQEPEQCESEAKEESEIAPAEQPGQPVLARKC